MPPQLTPPPPPAGPPPAEGAPRWTRVAGGLLLLLTAATYLPVLGAGYVWDDLQLVVDNPYTASLSTLPGLFRLDLWAGTDLGDAPSGFYRPLLVASLAFDRAVAGLSPGFAHLHSLCWHLLAVALLGRLLARITGPAAALAGSALFALHPLQVEGVAWISARNDPMAAALLLGGLLLVERDRPRPGALAGGATLVLAALLTKESALLAPVLLALLALARTGRPGRPAAHLAVLAALGLYAALRLGAAVPAPPRADLAHLQAAAPPTLAWYARLLLWPADLAPGLHLAWPPPTPWWAAGLLLVVAGALVAAGRGTALAGLVLAGLALAPALGAVASQGLVADRYLYLPMAGLALAVSAALRRAPPAPALAVGVALALGGGLLTGRQVPVWHDADSLWAAATSRRPSPWVYGVVGRELDLAGRPDEAVTWYRRATLPPKPMLEACYRVAWVSLDRGQPLDVLADGEAALSAGCPPVAEIEAPMAVALALLGRWEEAELAALRVVPDGTGLALVVRLAAGARRGDVGPLRVALAEHPEAPPEGLYRRVAWLLGQAGEVKAADLVLAAGVEAGHLPPEAAPAGARP